MINWKFFIYLQISLGNIIMEWILGFIGFIVLCAICNNNDNSGTHSDISNEDIEYDYLQRQNEE